jgi:hypothetical protein
MTAGWASIYSRHCHGKLRQIKPEQLGRSARTLLPGDRIALLQPVLRRRTEVIAVLAERAVAVELGKAAALCVDLYPCIA